MVLRTARKGKNQGNQFWGCPTFPKCRGIVPLTGAEAPTSTSQEPSASAPRVRQVSGAAGDSNERRGLLDRLKRSSLESEQPDAAGRWSPAHRQKLLRYVYKRDGRRCGVCGAETPIKAAQVEHIVPKILAYFDVNTRGRAVHGGTRYKSLLHKLDNLQASHTYCNKNKGNTTDVNRWRHPTMSPLVVAVAEDGAEFRVPIKPVRGH